MIRFLAIAVFVMVITPLTAWAAITPNRDPMIARPEVAKQDDKPVCKNVMTKMRVMLHRDGTVTIISRFSVWMPCE